LPNLKSVNFIRSRNIEGGSKVLKPKCHVTQTMPLSWEIFTSAMGLAVDDSLAKFPEILKGVLNF